MKKKNLKLVKIKTNQNYSYKRKVIITDLILLISIGIHGFEKKRKQEEIIAKQQENYDKLKVYDLGYINCDRFYDEPKILFAVQADKNIVAEYFIVFNDTRGVLKGSNNGHQVNFGNVPKDKNATLYAVSFVGDKTYFYKKGVMASKDGAIQVELQAVDKSYVDSQLAMLK